MSYWDNLKQHYFLLTTDNIKVSMKYIETFFVDSVKPTHEITYEEYRKDDSSFMTANTLTVDSGFIAQ